MADKEDHDPIGNLHLRMNTQDAMLTEIRDKVVAHLALDAAMKPSLDELVSLWRGSKIISAMIAALAALGAGLWALFVWGKDHLK